MTATMTLTHRRNGGHEITATFELVPFVELSTEPGKRFYCRRCGRLGVHIDTPNLADISCWKEEKFEKLAKNWFGDHLFRSHLR